ncbi:hypothetical protein [Mycolicibacterium celeriflavum]|uniref:hypothetical protein n=1 Tax=Mycolicibacterium celeriflavum TaxID=1249101 RepID=UPI003CEA3BA1
MAWSGVRLTVLAGPTIPTPLPPNYTHRLISVDVTESDQQPSVFTLTFDAGRSRTEGLLDAPGVRDAPFGPSARVVVLVILGASASVLLDGIVTDVRLTPGASPGAATLAVTGEDVSYLIDRVEHTDQHPALDDATQVRKVLMPYLSYGIKPLVLPAPTMDTPLPADRIPSQQQSDLAYIEELASRHGYAAYMVPGPVPGISTFYWGPPIRVGTPQPALSVNLGVETNISGLTFGSVASLPIDVIGEVLDRRTGEPGRVDVRAGTRPPLAVRPVRATGRRQRLVSDPTSDLIAAWARAQAQLDRNEDAVTATGTIDGARYQHVLRPRGLVGVRGAGWTYDGLWYVQEVAHHLTRGSYQQDVTLRREGHGSTVPLVPVSGAG